MNIKSLISILIALNTLVACDLYHVEKVNSFDEKILESGEVSFNHIFTGIIRPKCVSCHSGVFAPEGIDLSSYDAMMESSYNPDLVVPFDAESSSLYQSVASGSMPKEESPLNTTEVEALKTWINAGGHRFLNEENSQ